MSREVNNWIMLLAGTLLIAGLSPSMFIDLMAVLKIYIESAHTLPAAPGGMSFVLAGGLMKVLGIMTLPLIVLFFAALIGPFVQVGPLFAPEVIKMDLSKISPIKGFGRLFSMRALVEFAKGILKIGLIGVVGTLVIWPYFDRFEHFIGLPMNLIMIESKELITQMMVAILAVLMVIALADLVYQRFEHAKKMRMSKQEIKDEYKQTEGDPMIKGRLRQLRAEKARQRMMQSVPTADVVITNPTHYSIALKYKPETMEAPVCVAKGLDETALRIREVAKEHNIILYENKPLARALYDTVDVDETIPPEQYKAVAEVISYVFKQKGRLN
jgi:flagellar biosynthetic protein FlhB